MNVKNVELVFENCDSCIIDVDDIEYLYIETAEDPTLAVFVSMCIKANANIQFDSNCRDLAVHNIEIFGFSLEY